MAIERNPNDPYRATPTDDELMRRRADRLDEDLQADPELAEGPASGGRIALFAIALVAVLGVVFYGLNSSTTAPDTSPTAQTSPVSPSGGNTAQAPRPPAGQTTGSSTTPALPSTPQAIPSGNNATPEAPQNK